MSTAPSAAPQGPMKGCPRGATSCSSGTNPDCAKHRDCPARMVWRGLTAHRDGNNRFRAPAVVMLTRFGGVG